MRKQLEASQVFRRAFQLPHLGYVHVMIRYVHVPATLTCTDVHGKRSPEQAERGLSRMGEHGGKETVKHTTAQLTQNLLELFQDI